MKKSIFKLHKSVFAVSLSLLLLSLAGIVLVNCKVPQVKTSVKLEQGFQDPPESSKPRVWWHWMNGNITKAGIKADLEWMKRAGIGGLQNFNVDLSEESTPQIVDRRLLECHFSAKPWCTSTDCTRSAHFMERKY